MAYLNWSSTNINLRIDNYGIESRVGESFKYVFMTSGGMLLFQVDIYIVGAFLGGLYAAEIGLISRFMAIPMFFAGAADFVLGKVLADREQGNRFSRKYSFQFISIIFGSICCVRRCS